MFEFIAMYQTIVVGIIGFTGIIITLLYNAYIARSIKSTERRHEREVIRSALIEELKINLGTLQHNSLPPGDNAGGAYVPTDQMDDVYRIFVEKIGLLSQHEVRTVMYAYLSMRTLNGKLYLIGVPTHTSDRHVNVPRQNLPLLPKLLESAIPPVQDAINALEDAKVHWVPDKK